MFFPTLAFSRRFIHVIIKHGGVHDFVTLNSRHDHAQVNLAWFIWLIENVPRGTHFFGRDFRLFLMVVENF